MSARDDALHLVRAHLVAAAALVDALAAAEPAAEEPPEEGPGVACPHCGEAREEKLEDTSTDRPRMTCLTCDKSFAPTEVQRG